MGEQPLYQVTLSFTPDDGGVADTHSFNFGLRTIEMAPLPGGPRPDRYNWTFVVNGAPMFIKGTNWCTLDALLDFSRARYERFIKLAAMQHVQMFRPWGSGMPETDDFYDLCDRYGILVMQEWPTAWNSHVTQPYGMLEETVRRNTLRIRNHPSLAMYGGGNESSEPFGPAIDMMGRLSIELDDTRVFHRGEPWGGSKHDYGTYWGRQNLDYSLNMTSVFWGEFGMALQPGLRVGHALPAGRREGICGRRWRVAPSPTTARYSTPTKMFPVSSRTPIISCRKTAHSKSTRLARSYRRWSASGIRWSGRAAVFRIAPARSITK